MCEQQIWQNKAKAKKSTIANIYFVQNLATYFNIAIASMQEQRNAMEMHYWNLSIQLMMKIKSSFCTCCSRIRVKTITNIQF